MTDDIDPPVCPCCERTCIIKRIAETIIQVGADPVSRVGVPVTIPAWECAACGFGWRDHESEEIIAAAIRAHPEASKLVGPK